MAVEQFKLVILLCDLCSLYAFRYKRVLAFAYWFSICLPLPDVQCWPSSVLLARWCRHREAPCPMICRDLVHAFKSVPNSIGGVSGWAWLAVFPLHLRGVWAPWKCGTRPAALACGALGAVGCRWSVLCSRAFCRSMGTACSGYTKATTFLFTVELGGGQRAVIRKEIISKAVATVHVMCGVS